MNKLRVIILKPSKYASDGYVERYRWGYMPNGTVPHIRSMTPDSFRGVPIEAFTVDEYVHTNLDYLDLLKREPGYKTLLAIVGVQSHQFHRALDLAAFAHQNGCMAVIGGPHPMTCDTSIHQNRGISFALAEAELIWPSILEDAIAGELQPVYGQNQRWQRELEAPVVIPPTKKDMRRYVIPMLGLYPARGCPFTCNYCSVIKIAGRSVRSQSIETTIKSLRAAKAAGIKFIMFTSDNFNKYAQAEELLNAMIDEKLGLSFFVQCDAQIAKQEKLVALLARAGCFELLVGVESFDRNTLLEAKKSQNHPNLYRNIVELCHSYSISSHFSNIIGFPKDTTSSIEWHIKSICDLNPIHANFYILCPIPGTEQYGEFLRSGLITERNLDRFDATVLTWRHPGLSHRELASLLFRCYDTFYSLKHVISRWRRESEGYEEWVRSFTLLGRSAFTRYSTFTGEHPMAGGVKRVYLDSASDYMPLRKSMFEFEFAPLPEILQLPEADQALNRRAKIV